VLVGLAIGMVYVFEMISYLFVQVCYLCSGVEVGS